MATDDWTVDGTTISGTIVEERWTHDELRLVIETDSATVDALSNVEDVAGKLEMVPEHTGRFESDDRSGSGNSFTVEPPSRRSQAGAAGPHEGQRTYRCDEFETSVLNTDGDRVELALTLVPAASREPDGTEVAETASSGEWELVCSDGRITTNRLLGDSRVRIGGSATATEAEFVLDPGQCKTLAQSGSYTEGVRLREVPDGADVTEDHSPAPGRNTIDVVAPSSAAAEWLDTGTYHLAEWAVEWWDDRAYKATLTLHFADDAGASCGLVVARDEDSTIGSAQTVTDCAIVYGTLTVTDVLTVQD